MVVDSSAILALLLKEPERDDFATAISEAGARLVSSVNAFEASIVILARKGEAGLRELDLLLHAAHFEIVSFTADQLMLAREAYASPRTKSSKLSRRRTTSNRAPSTNTSAERGLEL